MDGNPFSIIGAIAEKRITEAMEAGEFDNLPGMGKPLNLENEENINPELRMAWKVLKNAGYVPPEIAERKEIDSLLDALEKGGDEREKLRQMHKVEFMLMRSAVSHNRPINLEACDPYYEKALTRLAAVKNKQDKAD